MPCLTSMSCRLASAQRGSWPHHLGSRSCVLTVGMFCCSCSMSSKRPCTIEQQTHPTSFHAVHHCGVSSRHGAARLSSSYCVYCPTCHASLGVHCLWGGTRQCWLCFGHIGLGRLWLVCWLARWLACLLCAGCAGCVSGASASGAFGALAGLLAGWFAGWLACSLDDFFLNTCIQVVGSSWGHLGPRSAKTYCCSW